jgi:iron complex outermembrane recepter protein
MKRNLFIAYLLLISNGVFSQEQVKDSFYSLTPVEVQSVRATENSPFTKTNISKAAIKKINLGQDLPFLLNQTPSVVVNADAGNGVGYTGIRIRGSDATRINVTLNGIPYNDAESQGTFFVDLPDFASSAGSIQIQRGVGTSSNGAGAFGGSINISTNEVNKNAYAEINNSFGSFNTIKNTLKAGTGLQNGITGEVRISRISSSGFIDRASSRLSSLYFTTAYLGKKTSLRLNVFTGKEKTYQAWNGISEADLNACNRTFNSAGTEKPGSPYDNEIDNYTQNHYQFFFTQQLCKNLIFNTALFLTKGKGYYEQYKAAQKYSKYGMPNPFSNSGPITKSDMIRRLWLNNDFYGNIFSFHYKKNKVQATLGGGYTRYDGQHFGKIIWAEKGLTSVNNWYDLGANKKDFNIYLKQQTAITASWNLFYDLQYRNIKYNIGGFRDNPSIFINSSFNFFNPKAGISYTKNGLKSYLSFSIANKEPNRDDFEANTTEQPKPERLYDVEYGIEKVTASYNWAATIYYMDYKNQLVLTGKINDVGAYTRTNIAKSYRAGVELQGGYKFSKKMNVAANFTLSQNKVKDFTEYIDDYDNGGQKTNDYSTADIAYSPSAIGMASINYSPTEKIELRLNNKYVSKQYLDNTGNDTRSLKAFFVQDFSIAYTIKYKWLKELNIIGQVNNLLNRKYEPNGYTFSYIYGGQTATENYYFPMAGVNFMIGINVRL